MVKVLVVEVNIKYLLYFLISLGNVNRFNPLNCYLGVHFLPHAHPEHSRRTDIVS